MTKATGIGRGGRRAGGRPLGSKNKRTVLTVLLPQLEAADQELPLYGLLRRISDESLDDRYRDMLRVACLPFLHSRPRNDITAKPPFMMSGAELAETLRAQEEHERQIKKGRGHLHLVKTQPK